MTSMKKFITALPIVLLLSFSFVSFAFNFDHLVYFRLALGLFSLAGLFLLYKLKRRPPLYGIPLWKLDRAGRNRRI